MTGEEAIKVLKEMVKYEWDTYKTKTAKVYVEALTMAIKALEQEPCDDAVSRQAVLDLARKGILVSNGNYESVCNAINQLPPVNPQEPKWIPVSERLPKPYEQVLRTVKNFGWNGTSYVYVDIGTICPIDTDVIAWMPLPKPYKAESEE